MSFNVINPLMLIGLAGIALPLLAHLLSKKKYDVVQWGAMQFLELGRNARRKIRLEELLLMFLRMGLIALLAVALARPWASGGLLANLISKQARDVVFVIDGSYSMGWEGKAVTPHAAAIQWTHEFLEELRTGDTVALLDARDQVRSVIESPSSDFGFVREQLSNLPPPAGSSNLADATARAVQILSRTSNLAREVIVLTDGQARGWSPYDENLWTRFDDLRQQPSVEPRVWVINVGTTPHENQDQSKHVNFSIDRLQLSRELTVVNFPVRIKSKVHYSGGESKINRQVFLEVDGQRLADKTLQIQLEPDGEASIEFEYRFPSTGSHLISVVLEDDNLSGDNRADAAINVADALSVLLIDGDPNLDVTQSETFFAKAALTAASNDTPWILAKSIPWTEFSADDLQEPEVVILANVPRLNESQAGALKDYVTAGGGLCVALGDQIDAGDYNLRLYQQGSGILPASVEELYEEDENDSNGSRIIEASLELPWMIRFRSENGGTLSETRFTSWWKIAINSLSPENALSNHASLPSETDDNSTQIEEEISAPVIAANLETGDPLLITRKFGRGEVALMTSSIDADWSTLPAKPDFVPLLHEIIFHLASGKTARNVEVGTPLILPVPVDFPVEELAFFGPGETRFDAQPAGDDLRPLVSLNDTKLPGIYSLHAKDENSPAAENFESESFVVNFDRGESDLTPLDESEREILETDSRMAFIKSREQLREQMFVDNSRTEFWQFLLFAFLGILVFEVVMTRRLVQGGHEDIEGNFESEQNSPQELAGSSA